MDACDAPRSARHDRRADASSNDRPEQMPALRSLRTTGSPWPRSIYAIRASQPALRRDVLCFQRLETLAFTALHVGFVARARARRYPAFAEATAGKPARAKARALEPPVCDHFVMASRGSLGSPSGIVRLSSHGSSLPGGAGLADLPGAAANRLRGRHGLAPPCKDAPRRRPSGTRLVHYVVDPASKIKRKIRYVSKKISALLGRCAFP